ncbi:YtxH domain-containing protein [Flavobacterium foetidum]|uniref:YtxH domain-containing protein n=1 Tax=Flavobacterium foetidum TaxID=2026681 RepID=UPI001074C793|nr:YtxH domain-containing protein [Flavobacterium foetidum]KAF2517178.1 YtxH domain-containing protein [Flavobacterium foetidum]
MRSTETICALLGGFAIGAALGVLYAPEKGEDLRNKIADMKSDCINKLKDKLSDLTSKTADNANDAATA